MSELRPYLRLLGARWPRLALGGALLLATTLAGMGLLALSGWFITATGAAAAASVASLVAFEVYTPGGAIRAFALGRTAARYGERLHNHDAVLRILADLRTAVFARLTRLDSSRLFRFRSADLLSRLTADIDALDALYLRTLAPPIVALVAIASVTGLIGWFAPALAPIVGGVLALLWGALVVGGLAIGTTPSEAVVARTQMLRRRVLEHVEGLSELLCFGTLERHAAVLGSEQRARALAQRRLALRHAVGEAVATAGVQLASAAALVGGVALHAQGSVSVAVVVLMSLAPLGLAELLGALPGGFIQLGRSRSAARRINDQMAVLPGVVDPPSPRSLPAGQSLVFTGVTHRYSDYAPPVLDGLDLSVAEGERVAVVGRSGAGKSTLAALALRRLDPDAGRVCLGDVPVNKLALADLRSRVAYLTQSTELLDASLAANLRIAAPQASDNQLWDALATAGLDAFVGELPRGLATNVGQGGSRLSGGQARRLSLARVVLRDPAVVILDEPLAGLDAASADAVSQRLVPWLTGRAVLMLGHATAVLPPAQRVVVLNGGRLAA